MFAVLPARTDIRSVVQVFLINVTETVNWEQEIVVRNIFMGNSNAENFNEGIITFV